MTEVERLTKMVDDMTMAAARSAIALLHSFGLSAREAEDLVVQERPESSTTVLPSVYVGNINVVKIVTDSVRQVDMVHMPGVALPYAGRTTFSDMVIQFDRLVPLGCKITSVEFDGRTYLGVMALRALDDCTYRCSVDLVDGL